MPVALFAAINVALIGLWVASLSNVYAERDNVRCGALAMASYAAENVWEVVILTGIYWGFSAALRMVMKFGRPVYGMLACFKAWLVMLAVQRLVELEAMRGRPAAR